MEDERLVIEMMMMLRDVVEIESGLGCATLVGEQESKQRNDRDTWIWNWLRGAEARAGHLSMRKEELVGAQCCGGKSWRNEVQECQLVVYVIKFLRCPVVRVAHACRTLQGGGSDDCVLLGGTSSSQSP